MAYFTDGLGIERNTRPHGDPQDIDIIHFEGKRYTYNSATLRMWCGGVEIYSTLEKIHILTYGETNLSGELLP